MSHGYTTTTFNEYTEKRTAINESPFLSNQGNDTPVIQRTVGNKGPLLYEGRGSRESIDGFTGEASSMLATCLNLTVLLVGTGFLSLPWAMAQASLLVGIGIQFFSCLLCAFAFWYIGYICHVTQCFSWKKLWRRFIGKRTAPLLHVLIFLQCWFCELSYI
eukprot:UN24163